MKKIVFALFLGGLFAGCNSNSASLGFSVSGKITCMSGNGLVGVNLKLETLDGTVFNTTTDGNGNYTFTDLPADKPLILTPSKLGSYYDGVTTDDVTAAEQTNPDLSNITPFQYLALPKAALSTGATFDIDLMKKLVQGKPLGTLATPVWQFVHPATTMAEAQAGPSTFRKLDAPTADVSGIDFVGVKFGDVNASWCK